MEISKTLKSTTWLQSILNSYSLIFFSQNNGFALCIALITFFTPIVGFFGLMAIVLINIVATLLGFNKKEIISGYYGFNALFVGLSLGYNYDVNYAFILLFVASIIILLLLTASLKGILESNGLPFLVFPFIITTWITSLSVHNFEYIELSENTIYALNDQLKQRSSIWFKIIHSLDESKLPYFVTGYLKTMAGIFFQETILAGSIVALGLLQFSRISFSLSILGFSCAYFYCFMLGADIQALHYNLLGANFIFVSIAIGCFFIIPNIYSYIAVILLSPIVLVTSLALNKICYVFQLNPYSLSFCIIVIGCLQALKQRLFTKYLKEIVIQYFSPEKTIYKYLNSIQRFKNEHLYKVSLPFIGEWNVSQGYDGNITHLGYWSKALDFVIKDELNNTYRMPKSAREGFNKTHFYCYDQDIISPFDGYVYSIINTVEDNDIGDMDIDNNWGNTIILNHLNGLYSQISHIKKDTFGVSVGQFLPKGTFIAKCGNSGRSPEPHIHFQFQTTPFVGEKTLAYPISYFIERTNEHLEVKISEVPKENAFISNVNINYLLSVVYALYPGQKYNIYDSKNELIETWEIFTNAYNKTYISCLNKRTYAYFVNDGTMLYFTDFEGSKNTVLFHFYLALYRQLQGFYKTVVVTDKVPLIHFNNSILQNLQDFAAPFYLFTRADFSTHFLHADNETVPQHVVIRSEVKATFLNKTFKKINYEMVISEYSFKKFTIHHKSKSKIYSIIKT